MFQTFASDADPARHPPRLAALRKQMIAQGLDAFIVPRADAHQGEYVAECDARLRWLTGFTGSAGIAIVTHDAAGVLVDGRYRVQLREQVDTDHFTPVAFPETRPADWLAKALPHGGKVGFDPWLHTHQEIAALDKRLRAQGITLAPVKNPVDAIWTDRPPAPAGAVRLHDDSLAGATAADKREILAATLREAGQSALVITLADSLSWLLNIRGSDLPCNPVVLGFAILHQNASVQVFADPGKVDGTVRDALGPAVSVHPVAAFPAALTALTGTVRLDPASVPQAVADLLDEAEIETTFDADPIIMAKAVKTEAEIAGMRAAHLTDGAAMVRFLRWLDATAPGDLTEIDVTRELERIRREAGILDISFDTICGVGPHAALPHYRVTEVSNAALASGQVLLVDSGGQYPNGTTDITRTMAVGEMPGEVARCFTRVLQGMIGISRLRFPRGLAGRDLDAVARAPLWVAGLDYDHGTGHGVGAALCVHEGPARISRASEVPLQPGMILSNEPGYYREGAFGIRIENLLAVTEADSPDGRDLLGFETLTFVPIDRRLIVVEMLSGEERQWLNDYHARVMEKIGPLVDSATRDWLQAATAPV